MMKSRTVELHVSEDNSYEYYKENEWVSLIAGYRPFKRNESGFIPNSIYRGILLLFQIFAMSMCIVAAVISFGNTIDTIQAIHVALLVITASLGSLLSLISDKIIKKTLETFRSGVYHYNEGTFDDEHEKIKNKYLTQLRIVINLLKKTVLIGTISNAIFVPIVQLLTVDESSGQRILNPYLQQPVYMPFNSRTVPGYVAAFIINVLIMVIVVSIVTSQNSLFITYAMQMKAQFEILNFSVRNLEKRACVFIKKRNITKEGHYKNLVSLGEFQDCMYKCLRSDILHHHALLRLNFTFERWTGIATLILFLCSSLVLAAQVILILEVSEIQLMANFIMTLICEMSVVFQYCWFGEELTAESMEVYYSLYFTPWYNCDNRFKKLLSIMLSNTRTPLVIKSPGLNFTASLHSSGTIISTMYQMMNVIRNT